MKIKKSNLAMLKYLRRSLAVLGASAVLFTGTSSYAASGTWTNTAGGTWSTAANWTNSIIADGAGNTATFTNLDLTAPTTVTLDSARTISDLNFGDADVSSPNGWIFSNGGVGANVLTLSNGSTNPVVTVHSTGQADATNDLLVSVILAGTQGFVKKGTGTMTILTNATITGAIRLDEGLIALGTTNGMLGANKEVQFNGGGLRVGLYGAGTTAYTNRVLTTGIILVTNNAHDIYSGPWVGSGSMSFRTSVRFTTTGQMTNFNGTVDMSGSTSAGIWRINLGTGATAYDLRTIALNLGTDGGRAQSRVTILGGNVLLGSLAGGSGTVLTGSDQNSSLTIWNIGALNTNTVFGGRILDNGAGRQNALVKVGSGSLTLTNSASSYSGTTTVSNGVLALSGAGNITASPKITVVSGATFDVSGRTTAWGPTAIQTLAGSGVVTGNVVVATGTIAPGVTGVGTLSFSNSLYLDGLSTATNLLKLTSPGTGDLIQVAGDLSFSNTVAMRVVPTGASIPDGTYTLMKWGGNLTGDTNNMALEYPAQPGTFILQTNLVAKEIRLVVSGVAPAANLVWHGDGAANDWDSATTNWLNGASPSLFVNGDKVTFNDTGSNNVPVNLALNVNPGSLLVNATKPYTIGSFGSFGIIGSTTLVKSNTGVVAITADNSFSGGTLIVGGTVQIGDGSLSSGSLGSGNVTNNATLIYNRPDNLTNVNLIVGTGTVVKSAANTLTIAGNNTYAGGTVVSNGTLNINAYNTLGTGPMTMAGGTFIIVPTGSSSVGVSNNIVVVQDSTLQYNGGNSFAAVIFGALSGTSGKTLTVNHTLNGGQDRLRLYGSFTNDANLVLNGTAVWLAPYAASGTQLYNGLISGPGNFVNRAGGSTIIFNNTNIFTGETRITTGTYGVGVDSVSSGGSLVSSPLGMGSLVLTNENDGVGGNGGITAVGGARTVANPIVYSRSNAFTLIISGTNDLTLRGAISLHGQIDGLGGVERAFQVDSMGRTIFAGPIGDNALNCGVTKTGTGLLLLNGTNTYTGITTVSAGQLGGTGIIVGPVVTVAGSTFAPGASIGTLTVSNNLNIGGNLFIEVNKSLSPSNDLIVVSGVLTNSGTGTVTVTNLGVPTLVAGDKFKLFSQPVLNGGALTITPDPGAGLIWTNKLTVDGTIAVLSTNAGPTIATNRTNITMTASGGNLNMSWPADHIGWSLQAQTNTRAIGLNTNWFTLPGYETTNVATIAISPVSPTVFYRLFYLIP